MSDGQSGCPGHGRHWFAVWGAVGVRSPTCVRCGAPNPKPLTAVERAEYEAVTRSKAAAVGAGGEHTLRGRA